MIIFIYFIRGPRFEKKSRESFERTTFTSDSCFLLLPWCSVWRGIWNPRAYYATQTTTSCMWPWSRPTLTGRHGWPNVKCYSVMRLSWMTCVNAHCQYCKWRDIYRESTINVWFPFMYSQKRNCAASLFPKQIYNVLFPNSYTHISVRDLCISRIGLSFLVQPNMWTDPGNI